MLLGQLPYKTRFQKFHHSDINMKLHMGSFTTIKKMRICHLRMLIYFSFEESPLYLELPRNKSYNETYSHCYNYFVAIVVIMASYRGCIYNQVYLLYDHYFQKIQYELRSKGLFMLPQNNAISYENYSIVSRGSIIRNYLQNGIESTTSVYSFMKRISGWSGADCDCQLCK